jgi:glycosyltransferase involved in cell wall biosynthesis
MSSNIAILLSVYNGQLYLKELLDSIFQSTFNDFTLYIRDDGSNDGSMEIICQFQELLPNIEIISTGTKKLGPMSSFMEMLKVVNADYYLFADQDDVWRRDKIELLLNRLQQLEKMHGSQSGIIVHSDLAVVDKEMNLITESFHLTSKVNHHLLKTNFRYYFITNFMVGCSMAINNKAKTLSFPVNKLALMHDSWIANSVLISGGIIDFIPETLVCYRQHENNVIGAIKTRGLAYYLIKAINLINVTRNNYKLFRLAKSLNVFNNIFSYLYYKLKYLLLR